MIPMPRRKAWDGRRAAPYAGPDPLEASRQLAEAEAAKRRAEEAATGSEWDAQVP
jgi:hypothetical protein